MNYQFPPEVRTARSSESSQLKDWIRLATNDQGSNQATIQQYVEINQEVDADIESSPDLTASTYLDDMRSHPGDDGIAKHATAFIGKIYLRSRSLPNRDQIASDACLAQFCESSLRILDNQSIRPPSVAIQDAIHRLEITWLRLAMDRQEYLWAESIENRIVRLTPPSAGWHYGDTVHNGNMKLAQIALFADNPVKASRYLLQAARTPGSDSLRAAGPQFPAVPGLLRWRRWGTVRRYLRAVAHFWRPDLVNGWAKTVASGRVPNDSEWTKHTR